MLEAELLRQEAGAMEVKRTRLPAWVSYRDPNLAGERQLNLNKLTNRSAASIVC
jgi:hypothetical protein